MSVNIHPRELEALKLLSQGISQQQAASAMGIGPSAFERHLQMVRARLNANNTLHAVVIAIRLGYIK